MAQKDAAWEGEMFRLLAENVKDYALFVVDPHRHVLSWSKGAERLLGFTEAEIVGRPCDCFFTPEDVREGVPQKELEQALLTGRGEGDRWHLKKDGSRFWSSGVVTPIRDEDRTLRGFAKILWDRTELKRAEEAAQRRQQQLHFLTDHAPVLIAHCDADRRYQFANKPYAARFGLHPRDLVGRRIREVLGEAAYAAVERHLDAALRGERVEFEVEIPCGGLGPQLMRCAYDPEIDPGGRVRGVVAAYVNITEARRAGEALRESEERFTRFMRHLPGLAWIKDEQGRYLFANDAAVDAFGKPRAELYGRKDEEVFPPATAAQFRENDRKALADGTGVRVVEALEHGDGVLHHSLVSKFPIPGPDGGPALVGGMAIDITEEVRTRAVLEESEERFRATFDQAAVGIAHVGLDGRWLRVNRKLCDIVGYRPDELLALTFQDVTHPDDLEADLAQARRLLAGEIATYSLEKRYFRRDRALLWINLTVSLVRTPEGRPKYFISVVEDITEKKRVQDALHRERELLQAIIDKIPVMLTVYEPDAKVLRLNPAFERAVGWSARDAAGVSLMELCYPDPACRERVREFMQSCRDGWMDLRMRTRDGRDLETSWANVRLSSGTQVGIGLDITDRKRYEEALKDADRRKDNFLATLAHELRNPLAPLRNGLEVMRVASGNAEAVEQARRMMERQLAQMVRLIDDLLDVSRITRGKIALRRERVELAKVVQQAVETSRPLVEAAGHDLRIGLPPHPIFVDADPTRLAQVFANLLTNAAKYTDRGGHIWLTAERREGEVVVAVKDSGIGIAAEHLPRLFEMFSQVGPALERTQGGLGIGLSLVKGLVEMHGGTVEARSAGQGKGSEFTIRLPAPDEVRGGAEPQPAGGEQAGARPRRRILVADDNRDAADSLVVILRLAGHEVHAAHDGQEAVEAAGWFRPDVALLDIGMPKMSGLEVAHRIREEPWGKGVVLVAITGWGQDEDKRRAFAAGFSAHLTKPVDPQRLRDLLAEAQQRAPQQARDLRG